MTKRKSYVSNERPKFTVSEFVGDFALSGSPIWGAEFERLSAAKEFAKKFYAENPLRYGPGYRVDVYDPDSGRCFLSLPKKPRRNRAGDIIVSRKGSKENV